MATVLTPMTTQEPFSISSTAFADGGPMPAEYTCRGSDVSPDLTWTGQPAGTAALVLFVDDPDGRDWVHWSVLDLAPSMAGLPRGNAHSSNDWPNAAQSAQPRAVWA